jgi:hypothetical protein
MRVCAAIALVALGAAGCGGSGHSATLSADGYAAAKLVFAVAAKQTTVPASQMAGLLDGACVKLRGYTDPEAKLITVECHAASRYYTAVTSSESCFGAGNAVCELAGFRKAAAALEQQIGAGRKLVAMLAAGPCRSDTVSDIGVDARIAQALRGYANAVQNRNQAAIDRERTALTALSGEAQAGLGRNSARLAACAPK